ncbi:MAG: hypothetical protein MRJ68_04465 [Nitrospira sp.]|nr:hypothetical protein [Nitrospira sp.]
MNRGVWRVWRSDRPPAPPRPHGFEAVGDILPSVVAEIVKQATTHAAKAPSVKHGGEDRMAA